MVLPCCNLLPLLFLLDLPSTIPNAHDAITGHTQYNATVKMRHILIIPIQAKHQDKTERPPNVNSNTVKIHCCTMKCRRE